MESYEQQQIREKLHGYLATFFDVGLSDPNKFTQRAAANLLSNVSVFFLQRGYYDLAQRLLSFILKEMHESHLGTLVNFKTSLSLQLDEILEKIQSLPDEERQPTEEVSVEATVRHDTAIQTVLKDAEILHEAIKAINQCSHPNPQP